MPNETPNQEVARLVASSGRTQDQTAKLLSEALQRPVKHYHVSRMISGSRAVKADELEALRRIFSNPNTGQMAQAPFSNGTDTIPLYASTEHDGDVWINEDHRVGLVSVHPSQRGVRGAFSFIMPDDSMGERIQRGEVAHVLRNRPPVAGAPCFVEFKDGHGLARYFVRQDNNTVFVRKAASAKEEPIALNYVTFVHAIGGVSFSGAM